jgi:hypothetical protein
MTTSDRGIFGRCPRCGRHDWLQGHTCPPLWLVWRPEECAIPEDGKYIYARSPSLAAELWAARDDWDTDGKIADRQKSPIVHVRAASGGEIFIFRITGHYEPIYEAVSVESGKGPRATTNRVSTKRKAGA